MSIWNGGPGLTKYTAARKWHSSKRSEDNAKGRLRDAVESTKQYQDYLLKNLEDDEVVAIDEDENLGIQLHVDTYNGYSQKSLRRVKIS